MALPLGKVPWFPPANGAKEKLQRLGEGILKAVWGQRRGMYLGRKCLFFHSPRQASAHHS